LNTRKINRKKSKTSKTIKKIVKKTRKYSKKNSIFGGETTYYLSRSFILSISEISSNINNSIFGAADSHIKISIVDDNNNEINNYANNGNETEDIKNNNNPVWKKTINFELPNDINLDNIFLKIELFDKSPGKGIELKGINNDKIKIKDLIEQGKLDHAQLSSTILNDTNLFSTINKNETINKNDTINKTAIKNAINVASVKINSVKLYKKCLNHENPPPPPTEQGVSPNRIYISKKKVCNITTVDIISNDAIQLDSKKNPLNKIDKPLDTSDVVMNFDTQYNNQPKTI
jgi:hypothetical protein